MPLMPGWLTWCEPTLFCMLLESLNNPMHTDEHDIPWASDDLNLAPITVYTLLLCTTPQQLDI